MKRIHIIYTGGTIGSERMDDETIAVNNNRHFAQSGDSCEYSSSSPFCILSENLTVSNWNMLLTHIKELDLSGKDALFITHGTDTLAYTVNLFSLLLQGINIPVFFISSNAPFGDAKSNGAANFEAAKKIVLSNPSSDKSGTFAHNSAEKQVEKNQFIDRGVLVPYKNTNGQMLIHRGEKLLQSGDFSDDFYSIEDESINNLKAIRTMLKNDSFERPLSERPLYETISKISSNVLAIRPYPGINYDCYDISNVDAILHGTYHSYTATDKEKGSGSLIGFAERAKLAGKKVYLAPAISGTKKMYTTSKHLSDNNNIIPLNNMSFEMSYAFLCLRYSK